MLMYSKEQQSNNVDQAQNQHFHLSFSYLSKATDENTDEAD